MSQFSNWQNALSCLDQEPYARQEDARKLGPFGMKTTEITESPKLVSSHRDLTSRTMIVSEMNTLELCLQQSFPLLNWALISQSKNNDWENILATGNQTSDLLITHIRAVSHSSGRD